MLRPLGYFVLVTCCVIYIISLSSDLTKIVVDKKSKLSNSSFQSDAFRYGDLFGMSYLPQFKIELDNSNVITINQCSKPTGINLFIVCDSYIWCFVTDRKYYCGVDTLVYARTNYFEQLHVKLNPKKRNVLLLEFSERNLRWLMMDSIYQSKLLNLSDKNYVRSQAKENNKSLLSNLKGFTFNKSINTNLELNTWDYAVFTPIKEFKSYINYKLLNSLDASVQIAPDNKRLLYTPTIDSTSILSSFNKIEEHEVNKIVKNLNLLFKKAKEIGYDDVYLSIIPNPVSILYPRFNNLKYNNLINKVQTSRDLKPTVIDVYPKFKRATINLYSNSDTHWNNNGVNIWLNEVNLALQCKLPFVLPKPQAKVRQ